VILSAAGQYVPRRNILAGAKQNNPGVRRTAYSFREVFAAWRWQDGYVERLAGSIRQECVDHKVLQSSALTEMLMHIPPALMRP